jgi:hypothetical protein
VRRSAPLLLLVSAAALAGCGSADQEATPVACLNGPKTFSGALAKAPGPVRLSGGVPISDCLVSNQGAGDLTRVGATLVRVATQLNAEARRDPGGAPTVQLGYLAGAVARGASSTQGIHAELVRRVEAAALYSPAGKPPPEPFDHTYRRGYAAGRDDG